jgi:hypothetical protein
MHPARFWYALPHVEDPPQEENRLFRPDNPRGDRNPAQPHPAAVATARMDEAAIVRNLVETLTVAKRHDCRVEVMLKDLHTVRHEPQRLPRWVELARQARAHVYG